MNAPIQLAILPYGNRTESQIAALCRKQDRGRIFGPKTHSSRRLSYFGGRAAAAGLLNERQPDAPIRNNIEYGYPILGDGSTGLYLSLAHTEGAALAAIGSDPVGIDIERMERNADKVIRRMFTPRESQSFQKLGMPSIFAWVAKEAISKALGLGMKFGMACFEVQWSDAQVLPVQIHLKQQGPFSLRRPAVRFIRHGNYLLGVASELESLPLSPPVLEI